MESSFNVKFEMLYLEGCKMWQMDIGMRIKIFFLIPLVLFTLCFSRSFPLVVVKPC